MGTILAGTFVTLDGVMQAPGGPNEDTSGGFEHGGWSAGYWTPDMFPVTMEQHARGGALLLGRGTWEIFANHWPRMPADDPMAAKLNGMPKYVVSDSLRKAEWNNSTIVRGKDLKKKIAELKAEPDLEVHVIGSAGLLQTLISEDLIDRYVVWTFPLVLGSGKRLFDGGAIPLGLKLTSSRSFESGVVVNDYLREGAIKYGSFALEEPAETSA
ncbi:MAG TPA: dihydrofolate reductase family protein [Gemmatimonadales bacterium]|nr:dihydrofolate reductase family protein [Gemmatimonadales bacterium]